MEKHLFKKIYAIFIRTASLWHFEFLLPFPPAHCDHNSTPSRWSQEHRDLSSSNLSRVTWSLLAGQTTSTHPRQECCRSSIVCCRDSILCCRSSVLQGLYPRQEWLSIWSSLSPPSPHSKAGGPTAGASGQKYWFLIACLCSPTDGIEFLCIKRQTKISNQCPTHKGMSLLGKWVAFLTARSRAMIQRFWSQAIKRRLITLHFLTS